MNKSVSLTTGAALIAALFIAGTAQAQSFPGLKDSLKKKVAEEVIEAVDDEITRAHSKSQSPAATSSSPAKDTTTTTKTATTASAPSLGKPDASLIAMTRCAGIRPVNITIGNLGEYTFQNGFSQEKRTGLINRKSVTLTDGCILPSLESRQVAYMEVSTEDFKAMGSANDWEMQCVRSADPGAGAVGQTEGKTEYPYTTDFLSGNHMMLYCGNSENIDVCSEGSNSSRSGEWEKQLKARGMTMLSVHGNVSRLAPEGGEKLYCQYYNSKTRTSLFAFEYLRTRN